MVRRSLAAKARMCACRLGEHGQLFDGFFRVVREGGAEQARVGQLSGEQGALGGLVEIGIGRFDAGRTEQLGHHALQHVRALA